eukprot:13118106-Alexandrium_andersonii.AAC.1
MVPHFGIGRHHIAQCEGLHPPRSIPTGLQQQILPHPGSPILLGHDWQPAGQKGMGAARVPRPAQPEVLR